MANYTKLMARLFNKVARKIVWPKTTSISLVKKNTSGRYEAYLTISANWFAYRTTSAATSANRDLTAGQPVIAVIITADTEGMTQANLDLLAGIAVAGTFYRKDKVLPPFGEPAYWRIEIQPTGEPFTA